MVGGGKADEAWLPQKEVLKIADPMLWLCPCCSEWPWSKVNIQFQWEAIANHNYLGVLIVTADAIIIPRSWGSALSKNLYENCPFSFVAYTFNGGPWDWLSPLLTPVDIWRWGSRLSEKLWGCSGLYSGLAFSVPLYLVLFPHNLRS